MRSVMISGDRDKKCVKMSRMAAAAAAAAAVAAAVITVMAIAMD